jgi:hypothetical protein
MPGERPPGHRLVRQAVYRRPVGSLDESADLMSFRALVVGLALAAPFGCASSVAVAPAPRDAGPEVMSVDVPPDPLDDPMTRIDCPPGRPDPCGPGRHCIAVGPGILGICVRDGARGGLCRRSAIGCDEGIPCLEQWCEQNNHFGLRTTCGDRRCGLNEGCVEIDGALRSVTFGEPGGYCRQDVASVESCAPGLQCDGVGNNRSRCGRPIPLGGACDPASSGISYCEGEAACVGAVGAGVCQPLGSTGAPCRANSSCDPGLDCQLPVARTGVVCLRAVARGETCNVVAAGSARCARGLSCAVADRERGGRLPARRRLPRALPREVAAVRRGAALPPGVHRVLDRARGGRPVRPDEQPHHLRARRELRVDRRRHPLPARRDARQPLPAGGGMQPGLRCDSMGGQVCVPE